MKCRACWSEKAYLRVVHGPRALLLASLGFVPLKCHHCYHKFWALWFTTWGKTLHPPKICEPASSRSESHSEKSSRRAA